MDIFAQIANATLSATRHPYIDGKDAPLGNYLLEINTFKKKIGQVDKFEKFIAEFKVLESDAPGRPTGSLLQWIKIPLKAKFPAIILGEVKSLIAAAAGMQPDQLDKQDVLDAISDENPLHGRTVRARVHKKPTKAGGEVTVVDFMLP